MMRQLLLSAVGSAFLLLPAPEPAEARVEAIQDGPCGFKIIFHLEFFGPGVSDDTITAAEAGIQVCWGGHMYGCCPVAVELDWKFGSGDRTPGYDSVYVHVDDPEDKARGIGHVARAEIGEVNGGDHNCTISNLTTGVVIAHECGHLAGFDDKYIVESGEVQQLPDGRELDTRKTRPRAGYEGDKMAETGFGTRIRPGVIHAILNEAGFTCDRSCWDEDTPGAEGSWSGSTEDTVHAPADTIQQTGFTFAGVMVVVRSENAGGDLVFVNVDSARAVWKIDAAYEEELNPALPESSTVVLDRLEAHLEEFEWEPPDSVPAPGVTALAQTTGPNLLTLADSALVELGLVAGRGMDLNLETGWFQGVVGLQLVNDLFPPSSPLLVDAPLFGSFNWGTTSAFLGFSDSPFFEPQALSSPPVDDPGGDGHGKPVLPVLAQNFPNPVRSGTVVRFELTGRARTSLRIFDAAGRLVRTLVDRELSGGRHEARWNACDDRGREVSPGVYFYQLRRGPLSQVRKLVVVR